MGSWGAGCPRSWWCGVHVSPGALVRLCPCSSLEVNIRPLHCALIQVSKFWVGQHGETQHSVSSSIKKQIKSQTRANFGKTGLVFQDLNATSEPKDLVEPYVSPFALCNAFSPFLAIWLWAQKSDYESCSCFQSLQYRLCWKPLSQSRAAQMVLGEVSVPLI